VGRVVSRPPRPPRPPRNPAGREDPLPSLDQRSLSNALEGIVGTGDVERDKDNVYRELAEAYREEERRQRAKVQRNGEAGYYFTVVCSSDAQARVLQAILSGAPEFMEYVDGRVIARHLGHDLADDSWKPPQPKQDAKLVPLIAPELDRKS